MKKKLDIYDRIKTLVKENEEVNQSYITSLINPNDKKAISSFNGELFFGKRELKLSGVDEPFKIKENKEDLINFVLKIPLEYRPFKTKSEDRNNFHREIEKTMDNEFLVINNITEEQKVKLNSMLDGFKNKLGTEWLLGFVDFIKEIDSMNLNKRTIENKTFSPNLEGNTFKSEQPTINAYKILEDATTLYINGTQLNATIEDKFNKGDYIVEDSFGKFINVSKEDFEAKYIATYKIIEKDMSHKLNSAKHLSSVFDGAEGFPETERQQEKQDSTFNNIIDEAKKTLTDKSKEYNDLKKELESAKVEIEKLREKLNGIENNFKSLS